MIEKHSGLHGLLAEGIVLLKRAILLVVSLAALLLVFAAPGADATSEVSASAAPQLPGPEQRRLERFVGSYVATVTTWTSPDAQATVTTMISEQRMIMGGRFLQVDDRSEDGSFHWHAVHGFNTALGHYRSVGMSNTSNELGVADSFISDDGEWLLFGLVGEGTPFKGVGRLTADGYTYVNYRMEPGGEEVRYREIVYRHR